MATPETLGCRAVRPAVGCYALSVYFVVSVFVLCRGIIVKESVSFLFIQTSFTVRCRTPIPPSLTCLFVCFSRVTLSLPVCHEAVLQQSTEKLSVIWRSSQTYQSCTPAYLALSKDKSGRLVQKERIVLLSCKASPHPTPSHPLQPPCICVYISHQIPLQTKGFTL